MKEHEDEVMQSVEKAAVTVDSTDVDEVVSEKLGGGEGKTEGILTEGDQGEDVMVDVVGSDVVEEDHGCTVVSSGGNAEELETRDQDMEDVSGLGKDCDGSGGIRLLSSEKNEVVVNEEVVAGLGEDCKALVETRVLASEKVEVMVNEEILDRRVEVSKDSIQGNDVITVARGSNGDVAVIDSKELTERGLTEEVVVESVAEVVDRKITGSANLGSQEVDMVVEDSVSADPSLVCVNNPVSAAEVVSSRTDLVDERSKEDSMQPTTKVITDDAQKITDGDRVVNEKIETDNEVLVFSKTSEPAVTMNPGSEDNGVVVVEEGLASKDEAHEDIPVNQSLVCSEVAGSATGEGEINVHAENLDQQADSDKLSGKESFHPTIEVTSEASVMVKNEVEEGLAENKEIMEQPTEHIQEVAYENGVMDDKTGKEDVIADSSKIPESLTTVNLGPEEVKGVTPIADTVKHPVLSCGDADMDRGEDAGMDIDEVLGWKDEVPGTNATSGAEKDRETEANVEQKLLGSSSGAVLIQHREESIKSREPIVYGRRVHVEVPLYESVDVEQKLPGSSSPVSEDENLKIETDSEEDDDVDEDDYESMQEDEHKVDRQKPELLENGKLFSLRQSRYFKPPENEGEFSVSDLVWGKVRSHPWWPGQIIDPSIASKKAMKYYKKDCFLVAYFGDHSFAWNSSSVLKPFWANFSQLEKQTDTEIFKTAISCAVEEVSRRVELGLACSCVPKENYKKIEYQVTENAGVRKKSNKIHGKDESASVSSFEPDKVVDYVRLLAQFPGQGDKLDLAIAKAQLSSYGRYKGDRELPEFWDSGDILEDAKEKVEQLYKNSEKFENELVETANPNKEVSLSDVTDDAPESVGGTSKLGSSSGIKKRKARVSISNGSVKRPNRPPNNVSTAPVSAPKPSFKIGQLIQRVASQLAGPKVEHGQHADQIVQTPEHPQTEPSVAEMLSQLHLTAQDPMKEYRFYQTIIPFFYERRAAVFSKSLKKPSTVEKPGSGTAMKSKASNENEPEEFEFDFDFDDVNDSYWTDRIIQNHSDDQPDDQLLQDNQNGQVEEYQVAEYEPNKPAKRRRRSSKKQKQDLSCNHEPEPEPKMEEESEVDRKRRENLATEVVLKFEEGINFCSEMQLNKMFRRFGPLMESETEVDREGGRARVVFKKCFDAEVAHNSAGKFNIFGSVNVSYEVNYSPVVSYKPLPLPLIQEDQMHVS